MENLTVLQKKTLKDSGTWFAGATIIALLLEILVTYIVEKAFQIGNVNFLAAVSSGLLVALVKLMTDIIKVFEQYHQTTKEAIKDHHITKHTEVVQVIETTNDKIVSIIKIDRQFYDDLTFLQHLKDLAHSKENISKMPEIVKKHMNGIMNESVTYIKDISEGAVVFVKTEADRITKINEVMKDAEQRVLAVTYDVEDYLMRFWDTQDYDRYLELNQKIAEKAKISRIFVVGDDVYTDKSKRELLKQIYDKLNNGNIATKIINMKAANTVSEETSSFILIDDVIASESITKNGNLRGDRYVSFGNAEIVKQLTLRYNEFDSLKAITL